MKDTEPQLLYPIYEGLCGEIIAQADETITIELAGQVDSKLLAVTAGHPIVVVERLALNYEGRPVEWRISRGAASDFRYKVEIR